MGNISSNSGCKSKVKSIAERVESMLFSHAQFYQRHYIRCFPDRYGENEGLDGSFMGKQMTFLTDMSKIMNRDVFRVGYVQGAECFFEAVGNPPIETEFSTYVTQDIAVLHVDQGQTNIFFVLTDSDDFDAMYKADDEYFDYMTEQSIAPHRELAYAILKYNTEARRNIVIVVNSDFYYSGTDFCSAGKRYVDKIVRTFTQEIGHQRIMQEIEVYPYDFYFKMLRDNLPVDYFINRISLAYEQHSVTLRNVGRLLYSDSAELVATFAFASNNYVGTKYNNEKIRKIDERYRSFPKPQYVDHPLYPTQQYNKMFEAIAAKASRNLPLLEELRVTRPLLTAEWLYNNVGNVDGFDNTFICFGYLKLVEILLTSILLNYYAGCSMSVTKDNYITISEHVESQLMLGNMVRFLTYSNNSALYQSSYSSVVSRAISEWTREIRNGYFHKHAMEREAVDSIRNKTFEVIYMLLGTAIP